MNQPEEQRTRQAGEAAQHQPDNVPPPSAPPPRGPRMGVLLVAVVLALAGLVIGVVFSDRLHSAAARVTGLFASKKVEQQATMYTCAMHPWVLLPEPGFCPICHMPLVPVDASTFTGDIIIDPVAVQNMGVRTEAVITGPLTASIRTVGTVEYAEPLVRDINTKMSGWVEKLHVDSVGAQVKAGEALFDVYSPELYSAQEEFLLAAARAKQNPDVNSRALRDSARTRLSYLDISQKQIDAMEQEGKPTKALAILSPYDGVVVEKNVLEGQKIDAGTRVYRLADLSRVWVMGTIYEYQLPYVHEGQKAVMSLPYIPGQTFEGRVIYVYPFLSENTRQAKVRLEFDNPTGLLKPGMFANITLVSTLASDRVLAPRSAIIDTGKRQMAYVSLGQGHFEPRDVQMGVDTQGGMVEIRHGLKPGERVVTSGQFLIDSEASIRESRAKMVRGDEAAHQQTVASMVHSDHAAQLPVAAQQFLDQVLEQYLVIGDSLAADSIDGIAEHSRLLAGAVDQMIGVPVAGGNDFWIHRDDVATVRGKALQLIDAKDIKQARLHYADLSVALSQFVTAVGVPKDFNSAVEQLHCPMFLEGQGGGLWMQKTGSVRNPYFGAVMLGCFDQRFALPVAP